MKTVNVIDMGVLKGTLYLLNNGYYSYKIRNNKRIIAQPYVWINGEKRAMDMLKHDMEMITGQLSLFGKE